MKILDLEKIKKALVDAEMSGWADNLEGQVAQSLINTRHGDIVRWQEAYDALPEISSSRCVLDQGLVQVGTKSDSTAEQREQLEEALQGLKPWRKGPYQFHGIFVDTEWRSDWKWDRLLPHIEPLKSRRVLDVGCGNGYHCWRMAAEGAEFVLGIDPSPLFMYQFDVAKGYISSRKSDNEMTSRVHFLPLAMENVPSRLHAFDTVFSMGILYHRRSPIDHLKELKSTLRPGGELVLETLIVDGDEHQMLMPPDRYAKMRNIWFLPSAKMLEVWLLRSGFKEIRTVDINVTRSQEQRTTEWMTFESLEDFLDPADTSLTVEGHPAPKRAILIAKA